MPQDLGKLASAPFAAETRVYVTVARTYLGEDPEELWSEMFWMTPQQSKSVRAEVQAILTEPWKGYSIQKTEGETSWGGDSGEVVTVVLLVSSAVASGVIQQAVYDLFDRYRQRTGRQEARRITREEAVGRARWAVASRYAPNAFASKRDDLKEDTLTVVGEMEDREIGDWTVRLRTPTGWTASVTVAPAGDLVFIKRIGLLQVDPEPREN